VGAGAAIALAGTACVLLLTPFGRDAAAYIWATPELKGTALVLAGVALFIVRALAFPGAKLPFTPGTGSRAAFRRAARAPAKRA